jgi:xanthine dehydrogenase accessory factor
MSGQPVDSWDIVRRADQMSQAGVEFAMATVVWRQGPSSGQQGSRAIVTSEGQLFGWIGGACAEPIVIREAQRAIVEREARLLLLGTPEQFGHAVPDGMRVIPISCQSEGALEVYVEPVIPTPHLVVVGRSPMTQTLVDLGRALGWRADLVDGADFTTADADARAIVVIATQGHGDEEAVERAALARPAYVGLVASHKRGEAVLGYLADRKVPHELLDRVRVPVGLDLGHTTHREIAVAVLAELVQLRAQGGLLPEPGTTPAAHDHDHDHEHGSTGRSAPVADALDPVCGMTVRADRTSFPYELDGTTYFFCCAGCRQAFEKDPAGYLTQEASC